MSQHDVTRIAQWAERIDRMPRMVRIVIALFFTLALVVLAWLVVSTLFGIDVLDTDPEATVPLLIVLVLGLVFYGVGWWAMVGFEMSEPWRAGIPAVIFAAAGVAGLALLIVLALFGMIFGYLL